MTRNRFPSETLCGQIKLRHPCGDFFRIEDASSEEKCSDKMLYF